MLIIFHTFSSIAAFLANIIIQILGSRYGGKEIGLLKSVFFGFLSGGALLIFIEVFYFINMQAAALDKIASITVNFISYSALGYGYFHFINLGETARRIRILKEFSGSLNGLSKAELLKNYNAQKIIEKRIKRLIRSGQVIYKNNHYYIGKPVMLIVSRIIVALKLFVLGKKSEFD